MALNGPVRWRTAIETAWWAVSPTLAQRLWLLFAWPLELLYRLIWQLRRRAYITGMLRVKRAPVPVVVVGNLIVGGAGKTPCVIALAAALRAKGWSPGIISRGFLAGAYAPGANSASDKHAGAVSAQAVEANSAADQVGDEPILMRRRTGVPVWVGRDRAAVAAALCHAHPEVNVLISDDGLQHLALHRDAQLVVFDDRGAGNSHTLPAGPLREPMWTELPPRTLVLYNAPRPSTPLPGHGLARQLGHFLPLKAWWAGEFSAALTTAQLATSPLIAAAGIGHPARFFDMLEKAGLTFKSVPLADHAALDPRPWPADAACVIVTEKDAVKLPAMAPDANRIVVATLDFDLPPAVMEALHRWLPARTPA